MKTNLQKILSVSGEPGLFVYVSQATAGVIAESVLTGKRSCFGMRARMTSLADISIYTEDDEVSLRTVLENMRNTLGGESVSHKAKPEELKALFEKVLPDYDKDRFYVSHMRKVVEWYNILKDHLSLDFEDPEKAEDDTKQEEK